MVARDFSYPHGWTDYRYTNPDNLRPTGYTDELVGVLDALWLQQAKPLLERWSGAEQAGGKYDATLIAAGVLMALQLRVNLGLPSYIEKVDLHEGFDFSWGDGIRRNLAAAGINGRLWLLADAALETDHFRIRLGPLIGDLLTLSDFGIGQGKRAAVHLFGALVQGLPHELKKATVGIGLDLPRSTCRAFASATLAAERETPTTPHLSAKARRLGQQRTAAVSENDLQLTLESCTRQERLTILDIWAAHSLLIVQFVDDSFVFQSTLAGLRAANLALERFAAKWVHKFKGGKKRASVLAVGVMPPDQSALGRLQGDPVQLVNQLSVLGPAIDVNFRLYLRKSPCDDK